MSALPELQLLTFWLSGERFAVPVERVQEVLRGAAVTPVPLAEPGLAGLLNLRGEVIPAVELRGRLGLPDRPADADSVHLVVATPGGPVSLLVDRVGEVRTVPADGFAELPATVPGARDDGAADSPPDAGRVSRRVLAGAYRLPDALLVLVDVDRAVDLGAAPGPRAGAGRLR